MLNKIRFNSISFNVIILPETCLSIQHHLQSETIYDMIVLIQEFRKIIECLKKKCLQLIFVQDNL